MLIERLDGGAHISYFDNGVVGETCQTLVFVHGWGLSGDAFWAQKELGQKHRIIILDLRGCGKSKADDLNFGIKDLGDDVFKLIEKLKLENVHIIAWSMGAMAIWCAMNENKNENILSFSFIDMSPKILNTNDWQNGILGSKSFDTQIGREKFESSIANMKNDWLNFSKKMVARILSKSDEDISQNEIYSKLFEISKASDANLMAHLWRKLCECDARENIKLNILPCLLIYGLKNQLYAKEVGEYVATVMPNSYLVQFENCGHAPHLEEASNFNKILDGFIENVCKCEIGQTEIEFLINEDNKGNGSFYAYIGQ